jgi:hypothetical protein
VPIKQAEAAINLIDRLHAGDVSPEANQGRDGRAGRSEAAKDSKAVSDAARRDLVVRRGAAGMGSHARRAGGQ